jgi:chromosome segregation ATPase
LQTKLNEEKVARQKSDMSAQEKERQISMLSVDYRQMQQRLQKLEGEHRQDGEKVRALHGQLESEQGKKLGLQSEISVLNSDVVVLKTKETQLTQEVGDLKESLRQSEDQVERVTAARRLDDMQMKELQEQLEAEQHFSVIRNFHLDFTRCSFELAFCRLCTKPKHWSCGRRWRTSRGT